MNGRRSVLNIVLHSIVGFIMLIVLLIVANILIPYINNNTYLNIVQFFNSLLGLFIILFIVGMINSIFWNFEFPLNIVAPISGAILGVAIVDLVYKILGYAQTFFYFDTLANILSYDIRAIVFFAVLIIGYLIIISEVGRGERRYIREKRRKERYPKEYIDERKAKYKMMDDRRMDERKMEEKKAEDIRDKEKPTESDFSWKEVGNEFKKASLNVGKALNNAFEGKKEEDNKNIKKKKNIKKNKEKKKVKKKRK